MTIIPTPDAIDTILGISPGSSLDQLRRRRPVTRDNTQASFLALFQTDQLTEVSRAERFAIAVFVAELHRDRAAAGFYAEGLAGPGGGDGHVTGHERGTGDDGGRLAALLDVVRDAAASGAATGPYGDYSERGLQAENRPGLWWKAPAAVTDALGARLSAALEHAHLLVFRPREASPAALTALTDAGWSTTGIVTLSQLIAFLTYQLRVVAGLQLLAAPDLQFPAARTASSAADQAVSPQALSKQALSKQTRA